MSGDRGDRGDGSVGCARIPAPPRLPDPVPRSGVAAEARLALRQYLADFDRELAGAFRAGADAQALAHARADAVERVVRYAWRAWLGFLSPASLLAVGGFGRAALYPYSDVDLLILLPAEPEPKLARGVESFASSLWDLGLVPGYAVRTPEQTIELAAGDATVYTNLLDARLVTGDEALADSLLARLPDAIAWPPARYIGARRAEREARHRRYGDTAYNLEPNLKEGLGGLRDLETIGWLGRVLSHASNTSVPIPAFPRELGKEQGDELVAARLLDTDEARALADARATLAQVRYALHLHARRAEERLLFDYQRELARTLGYADEHAQNLAVEQFMQRYYRAARTVADIGEAVIERCAERVEAPVTAVDLGNGLRRVGDRLDVDDGERFLREPARLIEILARSAEPGVAGLRANAARAIRRALADPALSLDSEEVNAELRTLLARGAAAVDALAALARYGALARLVPAFGRVAGRMQYDLFHVYTVDEHTLRVLRFMARFADPASDSEFPLAHEIYVDLPAPGLLLLAGLFHDIAKGRGGDHSELGEHEAREFCTRLGLSTADIDLVAWLVRWHLVMSVTAQRQDITDPEVVARFAAHVGERERLDYLYLLTIADIIGTSPKLWNSWKARLLADLYRATRYRLAEAPSASPNAIARAIECRARAKALLAERGPDEATIERIWSDFPEESFLRHRAEQIAAQTRAVADAASLPVVAVAAQGTRGASEVFVYTHDRDGLFAALTATLDRLRLSIVEARLLASRSGKAIDTFHVLDVGGKPLADRARVEAVVRALRDVLASNRTAVAPLQRTESRTLRHFPIALRLSFAADAARGRTRVAIVCGDRPGLLAAIADTFREQGVRVHDARIATFGERAEDYFEITDQSDRPLAAAAEEALRAALIARVAPPTKPETTTAESHVRP